VIRIASLAARADNSGVVKRLQPSKERRLRRLRTVGTPREDLADKLREARIATGYGSQGALAKRLNVSRSLITKAENVTQPVPSVDLVTAWAGVTGAPLDELLDLVKRCRSGTPEWFGDYAIAEASADTLRSWSPVLVPGLGQTPDYARAVLAVEDYPPERLEELVVARMERQAVIERARVTMIIDEQVLGRDIGSPAVMAEQMAHLGNLASRHNVVVHVIPHGVNMGLWGSFEVSSRDGIVTVLLWAIEDIPSTSAVLIGKLTSAYERLLGAALPRAESLGRIRTAEEEWKTQV